jgi:hypothetical protein
VISLRRNSRVNSARWWFTSRLNCARQLWMSTWT